MYYWAITELNLLESLLYFCTLQETPDVDVLFRQAVSKMRVAGRMRPLRGSNVAREHIQILQFLKFIDNLPNFSTILSF